MNKSTNLLLSTILVAGLATAVSSALGIEPLFKLSASDGGLQDAFGFDVATDGETIIVGNRNFGTPGAAYLFDARSGIQLAKLTPSNGSINQQFGTTVAIDGTRAVVGSWRGAYVYDFSNLDNIVETRLIPTEGLVGQFGVAVDISGGTVIVGANGERRLGDFTGAAYLFDASTGTQLAKLIASDGEAGDNFGLDVAVDGEIAVVGSSLSRPNGIQKGSVYQFDASRGPTIGQELAKYVAPTSPPIGGPPPYFGYSLDISGQPMVAGQAYGGAYVWELGGTPSLLAGSQSSRALGDFVALDGDVIVIGKYEQELVGLYNSLGQFGGWITSQNSSLEGFGTSVAVANGLVVVGATATDGIGAAYAYLIPEIVIPEPTSLPLAVSTFATVLLVFNRKRFKA